MISVLFRGVTYLLGNPPNFEGLPEIVREKYDRGEYTELPDLPPLPMPPDWKGLLQELLIGDLNPIFRKITLEAISNPAALLARQDIYGAISNPDISDRLSALRAGLDMLEAAMPLTQSDRNLWNSTISNLNFPDEVKL
ncbi:MAG: hypothetical protein NW214_04070 [Pseudanabaenaceae cyanobacterium bins.39]|nr:hypothetical protein [Pseudanabaenaceae cyanobacterium bins.39]